MTLPPLFARGEVIAWALLRAVAHTGREHAVRQRLARAVPVRMDVAEAKRLVPAGGSQEWYSCHAARPGSMQQALLLHLRACKKADCKAVRRRRSNPSASLKAKSSRSKPHTHARTSPRS